MQPSLETTQRPTVGYGQVHCKEGEGGGGVEAKKKGNRNAPLFVETEDKRKRGASLPTEKPNPKVNTKSGIARS